MPHTELEIATTTSGMRTLDTKPVGNSPAPEINENNPAYASTSGLTQSQQSIPSSSSSPEPSQSSRTMVITAPLSGTNTSW